MNSQIFLSYIKDIFHPFVIENGITPPVILFVDGHISHRSLELAEFCSENKIVLVSFLPNATHLCQPMDVVLFKPVKTKWTTTIFEFKISHPNEARMSKSVFCSLLKSCLDQCVKPELLQKSFESTALFPFGAQHFDFTKLQTESNMDGLVSSERVDGLNNLYFEMIENLIEEVFPNRISQFEACANDWDGSPESKDLFDFYKKSKQKLRFMTNEQIEDHVDLDEWNSNIVVGAFEILCLHGNLE